MMTVYDMSSWDELEQAAVPQRQGGWRLPGQGGITEGTAYPMVEPRLATVSEERGPDRRSNPLLAAAALRRWKD